ncbi:hypothetical protein [Aliivibrio finisterrensis]|uniref:Uncharacterized protein n=1 Tax=Aliivibrio finisterrensis TaxID=511998 RepID=A0A6N6RNY1_9GAMM|nr:hypothetical protein [Aliivibrio finisterrensis]KAB2823161.1 hypothetical protein F8B77_16765 [Aliivibrio finisterrensis]
MNDLYIIESPLQLLSAQDALALSGRNACLIVNFGINEKNNEQIRNVLEKSLWTEVHYNTRRKSRCFELMSSLKKMSYYSLIYKRSFFDIYIGDYRNIESLTIASVLKHDRIVLLDDGIWTLIAQNRFISKGKIPYFERNKIAYIRYFLYCLFSLRKINYDLSPNLYTTFDFGSSLLKNQVNLKPKLAKRNVNITKNKVYFYGGKLSESKILESIETELEILEKVYFYLKRDYDRIYYVPHRGEGDLKLKRLEIIGFEVKVINKPAELYFRHSSSMPEKVCSFFSTVLHSSAMEFNDVIIESIDIRSHVVSRKEDIDDVYTYFRDIDILVTNLHD